MLGIDAAPVLAAAGAVAEIRLVRTVVGKITGNVGVVGAVVVGVVVVGVVDVGGVVVGVVGQIELAGGGAEPAAILSDSV
jgi:hypothetical protein